MTTLWQQAELEDVKEVAQTGRADSITDQTVADTDHGLEFLSEGFLYFRKKNPKTTEIFWEGCLIELHLLKEKDLFQATSAGTQCSHRLTAGEAENRGEKLFFLKPILLKTTSIQNLGTSVTAVIFEDHGSPHMGCLVSLKEP